ncbi:MAG: glutathione S-transferase N-terminal domain-containing protein [Hyphomicrobium sp.]|jgi:GST-like protein
MTAQPRKKPSKTSVAKPIDFYFWPTPNGHKIRIMLEECGLAYAINPVDISKGDQFEPEYLLISPNNKMPVIVDYDGPGGKPISVFESGAILQYLGRKTGNFYPADERARVQVEEWLFWQVSGLGPMAGQAHHFRHYAPEVVPYGVERYTKEVTRLYGVMEKRLSQSEHLAGSYSIADVACYPWMLHWERQGQDLKAFPHVAAWLDRLGARDGVKRGMSTALSVS